MNQKLSVLLVLAVLLSACSPSGRGPADLPDPAVAPTPEELGVLEPVQFHSGLSGNLQARIASGEWTLEQGLIATLKVLTGEADLSAINPDGIEIQGLEASSVVRTAHDYLQTGQDPAARAEIERLLALLLPDPERLRAYSRPAQSRTTSGSVAMISHRAQTIDCRTLWMDGFPSGSATTCFEERIVTAAGQTYRIYFPVEWDGGDPRRSYLDATAEAVQESLETYSRYGAMPSGTIVFTLLPDPDIADALAAAFMNTPGGSCQIAVLPPGVDTLTDLAIFKQALAHEFFHCFQFANYYSQTRINGGDWWIEGTAEYFSNVVYPTVNAESKRWWAFDNASVASSLLDMDYHNEVFFQYLANQVGDAGVLALIASMPATGDRSAQLAALAAYPDIENIFHEFARAYLDRNIADTGGGLITLSPRVAAVTVFDATRTEVIPVQSFQIVRARFVFPEHRRYTLTEDNPDELLTAAKPRGASVPWGALPPEVVTVCGQREYSYLVTSASAADDNQPVTLQVAVEDVEGECDRCVVGSWQMDTMSHWNALLPSLSASGSAPNLEDIHGSVTATFTADGYMTVLFDQFTIAYNQQIGEMRADGVMLINGIYDASWFTDRVAGTLYSIGPTSQPVYEATLTITMGGVTTTRTVPVDGSWSSLSIYQCGGDALQIDSLTPMGLEGQYVNYTRLP